MKKEPTAYHHGDLRQALIEAALRALEHQGLGDISLRSLARDLGVSPRAPYRHYPSREALLAAVAVESYHRYAAFLNERVARAGDDPVSRLSAAGESYVLFAVQHPAAFRVMCAPYATVEESAPELLAVRREGLEGTIALITEGQRLGLFRGGDPMIYALAWWSTMHGLSVLLIEGQLGRYDRPVNPEWMARVVAERLLDGLLQPGGSAAQSAP